MPLSLVNAIFKVKHNVNDGEPRQSEQLLRNGNSHTMKNQHVEYTYGGPEAA